ncbi:MAG: hypothetical protein LBH76_06945, partial [Propionibacteriaceae bacterium]|nr:hypothetical protein [Propionibacteriaceae bacterium]
GRSSTAPVSLAVGRPTARLTGAVLDRPTAAGEFGPCRLVAHPSKGGQPDGGVAGMDSDWFEDAAHGRDH